MSKVVLDSGDGIKFSDLRSPWYDGEVVKVDNPYKMQTRVYNGQKSVSWDGGETWWIMSFSNDPKDFRYVKDILAAMSDETGEEVYDAENTLRSDGVIVDGVGLPVQTKQDEQVAKERASYNAWDPKVGPRWK